MGRPGFSPGKKLTGGKFRPVTPGPYSTTWSYISFAYNKNMADEDKYLYAFRRRVYNLHLIQISARYMHVWQQYSADKIWSRVPGIGPGFYSFPSGLLAMWLQYFATWLISMIGINTFSCINSHIDASQTLPGKIHPFSSFALSQLTIMPCVNATSG